MSFTVAVDQRTRGRSFKNVVPSCDLELRRLYFSCKGYSAVEFII